jgi:hypothetical protein
VGPELLLDNFGHCMDLRDKTTDLSVIIDLTPAMTIFKSDLNFNLNVMPKFEVSYPN